MSRTERRRTTAYKLRNYLDAIKQAEAMTDAEWLDNWVRSAGPQTNWIPRSQWLDYLRGCAILESERLVTVIAA